MREWSIRLCRMFSMKVLSSAVAGSNPAGLLSAYLINYIFSLSSLEVARFRTHKNLRWWLNCHRFERGQPLIYYTLKTCHQKNQQTQLNQLSKLIENCLYELHSTLAMMIWLISLNQSMQKLSTCLIMLNKHSQRIHKDNVILRLLLQKHRQHRCEQSKQ